VSIRESVRRHASGTILGLQLTGLPLVSFLPSYLGLPGRPFIVALYILLLIGYAAVMLWFREEARYPLAGLAIPFAMFLGVYVVKVGWGIANSPPEFATGLAMGDFASYLFMVSLPALIFGFTMGRTLNEAAAFRWLAGMLGAFLAAALYYNLSEGNLITSRLAANEILNPITTGQLAAMALVLGVYRLTLVPVGNRRNWMRLYFVILLLLGAAVLVFTASRGPLIAAVLALSITLAAGYGRGRRRSVGVALLFVSGILLLAFYFAEDFGVDLGLIFSSENLTSARQSNFERLTLLAEAGRVIRENPLLGGDPVLRLPLYDPYPHNLMVEAFMATGILGGGPFLLGVVWATLKAIIAVFQGRPGAWVGLLLLMILIGNLFSGNLYYNLPLWSVLGAFLGMQGLAGDRVEVATPGEAG